MSLYYWCFLQKLVHGLHTNFMSNSCQPSLHNSVTITYSTCGIPYAHHARCILQRAWVWHVTILLYYIGVPGVMVEWTPF